MAVNGIKANKCFESVITFRGVWTLDGTAAGATYEHSFPLTDPAFANISDNPCVVVTPAEEIDPTTTLIYGYIKEDFSAIVIGVKNTGSTPLDAIDVNFVVI